jgi:hypothetical protein
VVYSFKLVNSIAIPVGGNIQIKLPDSIRFSQSTTNVSCVSGCKVGALTTVTYNDNTNTLMIRNALPLWVNANTVIEFEI